MFTTVAWMEEIDPAGIFANLTAVPDQHIKVLDDSIYVNQYNRFMGAMACIGTTGVNARVVSPRLRRFSPSYIRPVNLDLVPEAIGLHDVHVNRSVILDIDEQLEVEVEANPLAAEWESVVAWLSDAAITPVAGEIFTVNAVINVALVAGQWAFANIVLENDLPVGNYDVVGLNAIIPDGVAIRLVPINSPNRPGVPCCQVVDEKDHHEPFRLGNMGVFCSFPHNNQPNVEVLGSNDVVAGDYDVFIDLIKK